MVLLATVFISTSGPLGRYMSLDPPFVILIRCVIGFFALSFIQLLSKDEKLTFPLKDKTVLWTGTIMCIHWVLFFYSLQFSTVAIAAVSVFTYPMQTIIIEAFIQRKRIDKDYLLLSFIVVIGVVLLNPTLSLKHDHTLGIIFGLLSGTMLALRNIYSKFLLRKYSPNTTYLSQVLITCIILLPFAGRETWNLLWENRIPMLALGIITTTLGHLLMMRSFKYFSASEVGLLISGQPISAMIIGFLLLGEIPGKEVIIGGIIILIAVVASFRKIKLQTTEKAKPIL
ncbi:MAG: DMT family transporter [Saprospiraceae bacterium]